MTKQKESTLTIEQESVVGTVICNEKAIWVLDKDGYVYTTDHKGAMAQGLRPGDLASVFYKTDKSSRIRNVVGVVRFQDEVSDDDSRSSESEACSA